MSDDPLLVRVAERTGMDLSGAQRKRAVRVLGRAVADSGLSAGEFAELLEQDPSVFSRLVDDLTVGETYFFRERAQLELVRDAVQASRPALDGDRPLRAWSAGCSTGEEAYTLAMLLHRVAGPAGVEVLGTDLSPAALATAARATYGARALRVLTDEERRAGFEPLRDRRLQVRQHLRSRVALRAGNLLDPPPAEAAFDVVLCRNVLIYLSPHAVAQVAGRLRDALRPSGVLLTGVADPVLEAEGLQRVATREGALYFLAGAPATRHPRARRAVPEPPAGEPGPRPQILVAASPATTGARVPRSPLLTSEPAPARAGAGGPAVVARELPATVAAARAATDREPLDAPLRYRLALLLLQQGQPRAAAEAAGAAVFLDPRLVVGHLLLGRILQTLGEEQRASRCFRTAANLLEQLPAGEPVPHADGESAESLARVVGSALGHGRRTGRAPR